MPSSGSMGFWWQKKVFPLPETCPLTRRLIFPIGCTGEHPYICHGFLGRQILDQEGLPQAFGKVAERHTGAGISLANIVSNCLPLPHRDMVPKTLEEKIICCADKFYSKSPKKKNQPMTVESIIQSLGKISKEHARRFALWAEELGIR